MIKWKNRTLPNDIAIGRRGRQEAEETCDMPLLIFCLTCMKVFEQHSINKKLNVTWYMKVLGAMYGFFSTKIIVTYVPYRKERTSWKQISVKKTVMWKHDVELYHESFAGLISKNMIYLSKIITCKFVPRDVFSLLEIAQMPILPSGLQYCHYITSHTATQTVSYSHHNTCLPSSLIL